MISDGTLAQFVIARGFGQLPILDGIDNIYYQAQRNCKNCAFSIVDGCIANLVMAREVL